MESSLTQELMNRRKENGTFLAPQLKLSPDLVQLRNNPEVAEKSACLLQKYPTFEEFAQANNPSRQFTICQDREHCVFGGSPWLKLLDVSYGKLASAIWLVPQIADVSVCCGLKEDAIEDQFRLVAMAISTQYNYLNTDELMLFFFNFKAGFYERFYSYFDPQAIIRSMKSFLHDRDKIIEVHERKMKAIKDKQDRKPGIPLDVINKQYFKTETLNKILHTHY